ncbi:hypothetical protein [Chryseobacterium sp. 5_R23647]|uniref:hypothetical protein n=1 Tax=Chryseobacterium sp. 5_R23647 TaxID=2258964 RepID=UPI000E2265CA|nr:hypothetical protein [Chryseobacterium sp. 5_R23647]REC45180.1 hypothetical protein DRF69_04740 [Chryseobacterium sp. 5_R23647]
MNDNNNNPKNPLELALEAFQQGTEKIENSRIEIQEFVEYVLYKQDKLATQEKEFIDKTDLLIRLLTNNLESYQVVANKLHSNYKEDFSKLVEDSKLVTLQLNEADKKSLQDTTIQIKNQRKLRYFDFGIIAFLSIVTIFSGYFATQFYKASVQTKIEARQEFLRQLEINNEIIVKKDDWNALSNERKMIKNWSKSNSDDSKSYETFRNGIISANPKLQLFENLKNDVVVGY